MRAAAAANAGQEEVKMMRRLCLSVLLECLAFASAAAETNVQFGTASGGYQLGIYSTTETTGWGAEHVMIHLVLKNISHPPVGIFDLSSTTRIRVVGADGKVYSRPCAFSTGAVPGIPGGAPQVANLAPGSQRVDGFPLDLHCWTDIPGQYQVTATTELFTFATFGKPGAKPLATVVSNTLTVEAP